MRKESKSRVASIAAIIGSVAALITAVVGAWALVGGSDSGGAESAPTPTTSMSTTTTNDGGTNWGGGGSSGSGGGTINNGGEPRGGGENPPVPTDSGRTEFKVTEVQLSVTPSGGQVSCNSNESVDFTFTGAIVANGAGEVRYRWLRSDGAIGPEDSGVLQFDAAGTKQLAPVTWRFGVPPGEQVVDGSYTLEVDAPNSIKKSATARISCF